jgi:hypothetical protein
VDVDDHQLAEGRRNECLKMFHEILNSIYIMNDEVYNLFRKRLRELKRELELITAETEARTGVVGGDDKPGHDPPSQFPGFNVTRSDGAKSRKRKQIK